MDLTGIAYTSQMDIPALFDDPFAPEVPVTVPAEPKEKLLCLACAQHVTKETMWGHGVGLSTLCLGGGYIRLETAADDGNWKLDEAVLLWDQRNVEKEKQSDADL